MMTQNRIRHLPVLDNNRVVGIISIGDVVKALIEVKDRIISEQAFELGQHERASTPGAV
jgi:CBS domain-containing protein